MASPRESLRASLLLSCRRAQRDMDTFMCTYIAASVQRRAFSFCRDLLESAAHVELARRRGGIFDLLRLRRSPKRCRLKVLPSMGADHVKIIQFFCSTRGAELCGLGCVDTQADVLVSKQCLQVTIKWGRERSERTSKPAKGQRDTVGRCSFQVWIIE